MPELPEVQTIVTDLNSRILNKKIKKVEVRLKKIVKNPTKSFIQDLQKSTFKNIRRRGKLLIFELSVKNKYLLIHLKMTGQLIYCKNNKITVGGHGMSKDMGELPSKYTHVIFMFSDGSKLFYNDLRRFGYLHIVDDKKLEKILEKFGIEPLDKDFTLKKFKSLIENKKMNIKAFLLNQKFIAGIGNIYADETLFDAGILPNRSANSLKEVEVKKLYKAIKKVLKKAVQYRGTTFNDYLDADGNKGSFLKFLKVYHREGKKCLRCNKEKIKKIKVAGRGTRYCEKCQK